MMKQYRDTPFRRQDQPHESAPPLPGPSSVSITGHGFVYRWDGLDPYAFTTLPVTELLLLHKLSNIRHNLLYKVWTRKVVGIVYIVTCTL
jgi:hypothetical protein